MPIDTQAIFTNALVGKHCVVKREEHFWIFQFGEGGGITVYSPWRLIRGDRVFCSDSDHGHKFGLSEPFDAEAEVNTLLRDKPVLGARLDHILADIRITFADEIRLEILNFSGGFEGWGAGLHPDGGHVRIQGLGGGDLAVWGKPVSDWEVP